MTLTIEVAPEVESRLQEKATRLGVPVERYAAGVLRQDVEGDSDTQQRIETPQQLSTRLMGLYEQLRPSIAAGILAPVDPSAILDAVRDEREAEMDAALWGTHK